MKTFIDTLPNEVVEKRIKEKLDLISKDKKFCEHLVSLGFDDASIKENISFIIDYYSDYSKCIKCKDVNACALGEHYIKRVTYNDGMLNFEYDVCKKYKKINRVKNLSYICDISDDVLSKSIGSDLDNHDVRKSLFSALYNIYSTQKPSFLFVQSKKKSGGSYMTSLFYKEIIAKHSISGAYIQASKRFAELSDLLFNNKAEFAKKLQELQTADILVINKISNYNFNEFTRNNILFPLLEERMSNKLTTILTSELKYEDFLTILNVKNSNKDVRFNQISDLLEEFEKFNISLNIKVY